MYKKPRSKKQYVEAIVDLLYMKEPPEADTLLGLICDAYSPESIYCTIFENREAITDILKDINFGDLKYYYNLAVLVADATHCDELNRIDEANAPKHP